MVRVRRNLGEFSHMLIVKSKYKIAKRLGAGVFEKTQSQKFALSEARSKNTRRRKREASDYGRQLLEKQRVRYTYGISEKQLSGYAEKAITQKIPVDALHKALEMRADNVAYRAGFATTRRAGRQMVSHGHLLVNGRRITTPSYSLKVLEVRGGSRGSALFGHLTSGEQEGRMTPPSWITLDESLMRATLSGEPSYSPAEAGLEYAAVFEFYSR
jgi:small subunit ribosomal protein S4